MTGFARRETALPVGTLVWEVRTVNHRYLEVGLRLPEEFRSIEGEARAAIASQVRRGKLDATLQFRPAAPAAASLEVNE
ncbi:MAG: YicC/YloC family endoribonuclease, partial [Gammaproteobacteria bacterium]